MSKPPIQVQWRSAYRKAKCPPNPAYPDGIDIVMTKDGEAACSIALPYPAPECGLWLVSCPRCGFSAAITAAGRPDDPRSAQVPCKRNGGLEG